MATSKGHVESAFDRVEIDRGFMRQSLLDIESGRRTNALPWRGQFSPEFVCSILEKLSPGGVLVDPFCGSGTTIGESARQGLPSFGVEVNAAAYILARVHQLSELSPVDRQAALTHVAMELAPYVLEGDLNALRDAILDRGNLSDRIVAAAVFLLAMGNGPSLTSASFDKACSSVARLVDGMGDPVDMARVQLGDSRSLSIPDGQAGIVFTSPPYVNVFNYHQNYRKAVELLGYEVLVPARSEIGSNRKFRQNRFLTVVQYAQDTALALNEASRVLRPGGWLVWVVGRESNVRGVPICNSRIAFDLAARSPGLGFERRLERKFRSRYGALVYEDVLVFRRVVGGNCSADRLVEDGREVGVTVLDQLLAGQDAPVASEICDARDGAGRVLPSPIMRS